MTELTCPTCTTRVPFGTLTCPTCTAQLPPAGRAPVVYPPPPPPGMFAHPVAYPQPTAQVVVVGSYKDPTAAALLGLFFGPLGLLYSTVTGAVIMFAVNMVVALLTFGLGLVLTWPISAVVGWQAAKSHNERLTAAAVGYHHPVTAPYPPTLAPAPGWYPDPHGLAPTRYWDGSSWTGHTA